MKKFSLALAVLFIVQIGFGSVFAFETKTTTKGKVNESNPGAIVVDVTPIIGEKAPFIQIYSRENQKKIRNIADRALKEIAKGAPAGFNFDPLVLYKHNGKIMTSPLPQNTYRNDNPILPTQKIAPSGIIDWRFTGSCQSGATPPDSYWNCATEMPNIQTFVEGGPGLPIGMKNCIQDVFGAPMFSIEVYFRRDDNLPTGTFAQYTQSGVGTIGYIDMPTDMARPPAYFVPAWNMTAQEARLDALTHEMVHAYYDDLNLYFHAWVEGMTEMQSILARRLWCQRNGYTPPNRPNLSWGTPVTLPLYENCNQTALQPGGGFFYTSTPGERMLVLAPTRYQMAASAWYKIWRETTPGIINDGQMATYGSGTFFVDFNSEYYDRYLTYPPGYPGIRGEIPVLNQIISDVLYADKANSNVENKDYITTWYGAQNILGIGTSTGGKLYVPNGPVTPDGGIPYIAGDDRTGICDIGSHLFNYAGASFNFGLDFGPVFYQTLSGGFETPLAGTATITAFSMHGQGGLTIGQDVTTRVGFHDAYSGAPTGWTACNVAPNPTLTFGADGRLAAFSSGAAYPAALYFRFDPDGAGPIQPLPTGGYQINFDASSVNIPPVTANITAYFASREQIGPSIHSGVMIGGGTNGGDRIAFSYDNSPFTGLAGFGGDASFNNMPTATQGVFTDGVVLGYQYFGAGAPYPEYDYVNTGRFYYVHQFTTSFNRLNQDIPPFIGKYGFAMLAQSTDFGGGGANRTYFCQFVHDTSTGAAGITRLKYRPDYIPDNSRLVACYLYANSVGRDIGGGNFQHEPILINAGRPGNPQSVLCTGSFLGRNNDSGYRPNCGCRGWGQMQSTFRFNITPYISDPYDFITVSRVYQDFEPGNPQYYGFEIVMIFENSTLPLSQIMIADGALTLCNNDRQNSQTVFSGFRTPPDPSTWPVDGANAGAYVGIIGNSADDGACGGSPVGRFTTEWDFWACGTNKVPTDQFWLNPQPADPTAGQGGPWWANGWTGSNGGAETAPTLPSGFPAGYLWSPKAMNPNYAATAKQYSCSWFWHRNFTVVAAKTAIHWKADQWWDYVNQDYDTKALHKPTRTYLAGEDSSVLLRPYLVCANTGGSDPNSLDDGQGPCVSAEWGNSCPPNGNIYTCAGSPPGGPWPNPYYPRSEERGHMHGFILQVPVVPSLQITKKCVPDPVLPDSLLIYTITVTNDTPYTQTNVNIVENYPKGVTFYDANPPPDVDNNRWTTSVGLAGNGSLAPHETFVLVVRVRVGHLAKGTKLTNNVLTYADTAPNPEFAQCTVDVLGEPLITLTKTTKKFMAQQGEKVSYTIIVKNIGTREATNVVVVDILPRELEYVASIPSGSLGMQKIVWSFGIMNPGEVKIIELTLRVRKDISLNPGINIINTAIVTSAEGLRDQDTAVIVLRVGAKEPVVCECPDISILIPEAKPDNDNIYVIPASGTMTIKVSPFGGCGPYTADLDFEGDGKIDKTFNIENDTTKEFSYTYSPGSYSITLRTTDRYANSCTYTKKIRVK